MSFHYDEEGDLLALGKSISTLSFNEEFDEFWGNLTLQFFSGNGNELLALAACDAAPGGQQTDFQISARRLCVSAPGVGR